MNPADIPIRVSPEMALAADPPEAKTVSKSSNVDIIFNSLSSSISCIPPLSNPISFIHSSDCNVANTSVRAFPSPKIFIKVIFNST